mgnify:CR=1 FL=1
MGWSKPYKRLALAKKYGEPVYKILGDRYFGRKMPIRDIAIELGVGPTTIQRWMRQDRIKLRTQNVSSPDKRPNKKLNARIFLKTKKTLPLWIEELKDAPARVIIKKLGISEWTVYKYKHRYGLCPKKVCKLNNAS